MKLISTIMQVIKEEEVLLSVYENSKEELMAVCVKKGGS
jgi:hypothetical protein